MGKRDEQYQLSGAIKLDEGFLSTEISDQEKDKPLKRSRGSQKKTKVLVMAESRAIEGETKKNGKPRKVRFIKIQVIPDLKADTITSIVEKDVASDSELITNDSTSYVKLKDIVDKHEAQVIPKENIGSVLPWVHIAISNAKRMLLDIYHDISMNTCKTTSMNFAAISTEDILEKRYLIGCSLPLFRIKINFGTVEDIHNN
jgi:hypothetical protein